MTVAKRGNDHDDVNDEMEGMTAIMTAINGKHTENLVVNETVSRHMTKVDLIEQATIVYPWLHIGS